MEYSEDETLIEEKQNQLKKECMDAWEIPIKARREPSRDQAEFICRRLLDNDSGNFIFIFQFEKYFNYLEYFYFN